MKSDSSYIETVSAEFQNPSPTSKDYQTKWTYVRPNAMVTNHLRAPYGVYFTKNRTILRSPYGARPAAERIVRFFIYFSDIVRCPVNFRYYLKFHGARTAFGRVNEGKMTSAGHRTVPGRRPAGVCTHRTGTGRFLFKIYIVRFPVGHRPMFSYTDAGRCPYDM